MHWQYSEYQNKWTVQEETKEVRYSWETSGKTVSDVMNNILNNIVNSLEVTMVSSIKQFLVAFICIDWWHCIKVNFSVRQYYSTLQEHVGIEEQYDVLQYVTIYYFGWIIYPVFRILSAITSYHVLHLILEYILLKVTVTHCLCKIGWNFFSKEIKTHLT